MSGETPTSFASFARGKRLVQYARDADTASGAATAPVVVTVVVVVAVAVVGGVVVGGVS